MGQISLGNGSRASINSFNQAIAARGGRLFGSLPGGVMSFDLNGTAQFNRLLEHVMAHSENDEPQNTGVSEARINRLPLSEATASQSTQTCTICMENFKIGEKLRTLPVFIISVPSASILGYKEKTSALFVAFLQKLVKLFYVQEMSDIDLNNGRK